MIYTLTPQSAVAAPVSTAEVKAWLDIDHTDDDTQLATVLKALSERIEEDTGLALSSRNFVYEAMAHESLLATDVMLPREPVTAISSVKVIDSDADETALTEEGDYVRLGRRVRFVRGLPLRRSERIEITFTAGYADSDAVPAAVKLAMMRFAKAHYDLSMDAVLGLIVNRIPIPELDILFNRRKVLV